MIERAFRTLHDFPQAGRQRDDLFPGCRTLHVEQHVIYYHQPDPDTIVVRRILHDRQDPTDKITAPLS